MSKKQKETEDSEGIGCLRLILTVLILTAVFFGLPVGKHKWNIDFFPPRIWDMNDKDNEDKEKKKEKVAPKVAPVVEPEKEFPDYKEF